MKRLAIAPLGLALVLSVAAIACADDTQQKGAAFDRGYLAGHDAGLRDGQEAAYQDAYDQGAEDGRSDVDSVVVAIISGRLPAVLAPYVAWCDVALHCPKAVTAANEDAFPHTSIPTVDVDKFEDVDAAYAAGFGTGHQEGQVAGQSLGRLNGYSKGYTDTTCATQLAKLFGMYCPRR